jgi:hypothetical protein
MRIHAYKKLAGLSELGRPILLFIPASAGWSIADQVPTAKGLLAFSNDNL